MRKKSKITKILNSEENQTGKSLIIWQNQMTKHIKNEWTRTVIFLNSDLLQAFPNVENGGLLMKKNQHYKLPKFEAFSGF